MCFSATASFTSAAILSGAGVYNLAIMRKKPAFWAMAAIPLFFALQQFHEGLVWLSMYMSGFLLCYSSHTYLFFAYVFWPIWLPISLYCIEPDAKKKWYLLLFVFVGIFVAIQLYLPQFFFNNVLKVSLVDHSLAYTTHLFFVHRMYAWLLGVLYLTSSSCGCFISSYKQMRPISIYGMVSFIAAYAIKSTDFISVWCFFSIGMTIPITIFLYKIATNKYAKV